MDTIWGSTAQYTAIAWSWEIAIYLFLAGLSAGAVIISIFLQRKDDGHDRSWNGVVKAGALLAPLAIIVGLGLLIIDLGKPLSFYLLMIYYQPSSVMSIGVILLAVYTPAALLYAITVFQEDLGDWAAGIAEKAEGRFLQNVNLALAIGVGCYTGFLLSAMIAKPLYNVAVLPLLFLVSGLSAGAAASLLTGLLFFRDETEESHVSYVYNMDSKIMGFELIVLFLLFVGLHYQGGAHAVAAQAALSQGIWAYVFWLGVVGAGLVLPLALHFFQPGSASADQAAGEIAAAAEPSYGMVMLSSVLVLAGGLLLRFYILYAGQIFPGV